AQTAKAADQVKVADGSLAGKHIDVAASSLGGKTLPVRILLPRNYESSKVRYPVLYLLHGLTGNEDNWVSKTKLAEYASNYRLIIVMPGVGNSWYANSFTDKQARYEDVIVKDLIQYIDQNYRTDARREARAIAGLSMGGLGAVKFGLAYPELFAFAAGFSGAFNVPRITILPAGVEITPTIQNIINVYGPPNSDVHKVNDVHLLVERKVQSAQLTAGNGNAMFPYLYLACGESDPQVTVMPGNPQFVEVLRKNKVPYEYHERPGVHDWKFWDAEIRFMLERLNDFVPIKK
ncbi:MAG: alpha/beta hydrolase, partial [Pyrinomonadaceae bacterium]